jgi:hypothetical protein
MPGESVHDIAYELEGRSNTAGGNEMAGNLRWSLPLILAVPVALIVPASAQQDQSGGTVTAIGTGIGTGSNSNAAAATSSFSATTSSSGSNSGNTISLPNGRRVSRSNSTVTVCDDPGAPFPDAVDVCGLK